MLYSYLHFNTLVYISQYTCVFELFIFLIKNTGMNKPMFSQIITDRFLRDPSLQKADGSLNVTQAAAKVRMKQPTLKRIVDGSVTHMRPEQEEKLIQYFGLSSRSELYGDINSSTDVSHGRDMKGLVPVISWVQAGQWNEVIDVFEPYEAEELRLCMVPHGPQTYCLRVDGDSMTSPIGRTYPQGCLIFVDPEQRSVVPGDRVIAKRDGDNGVTFKQLAKDGDKLYLKALNPNHPPLFDEFRVLGKVIGMWMDE